MLFAEVIHQFRQCDMFAIAKLPVQRQVEALFECQLSLTRLERIGWICTNGWGDEETQQQSDEKRTTHGNLPEQRDS